MANQHAAIPEAISQLLAIFADDLAQVRFGELDRTTLDAAAATVATAALALAEAEAVTAAARVALLEAQETLRHKGQRALAHARIYAEGSPELLQRLQDIVLDRGGRSELAAAGLATVATRRRGRPARSTGEVTGTLLLEEASTPAAAP